MPTLVFLLQLASTWFLVGLIWTIQVVHYPLFAGVGADRFPAYEADHARLITLVVGPTMLLEALTALAFVTIRPPAIPGWVAWAGLGLVAVIWLSTAAVQVPAHARLADGFDPAAHARLVGSNWIRTIAWTLRGLLLAGAAWPLLSALEARP
ncbi:MAG: hypothetical protein VX672_02340 [Planctomycetota bacterium]|nr:hypothetical protein [Planctomycetota bacterium]